MLSQTKTTSDEIAIRDLHRKILDGWNRRNARDLAALFTADGSQIGFDGSQCNGRGEIEAETARIFVAHQTGRFIGKIREVRFLTPEVALLRAVANMVPPGQTDVNPATNMVQSLVGVKQDGNWRIALFHNTPAQFHGRPELSAALTEELRQML
jgi:uncharacterized protein (TIGR02246 family)